MNELVVIENKEVLGKTVKVYGTPDEPLFLAKEVAEWIEYNLSNVHQLVALVDDAEKVRETITTPGGNQNMWFFTEDGLYEVLMQSRKPVAKQFKKKIKEILKDIRKHGLYATDDFMTIALNDPDRMIAMIQSYKFEKEKRRLAEQQRDEALRTKAWISDKKTATAMNTASVAIRQNEKLKEQIGDSKTYKQAKAITWLPEFFSLRDTGVYKSLGHTLSKLSDNLGYEFKVIESSEFPNGVKAYHKDVIDALKHKLINDRNMMRKYRI